MGSLSLAYFKNIVICKNLLTIDLPALSDFAALLPILLLVITLPLALSSL